MDTCLLSTIDEVVHCNNSLSAVVNVSVASPSFKNLGKIPTEQPPEKQLFRFLNLDNADLPNLKSGLLKHNEVIDNAS